MGELTAMHAAPLREPELNGVRSREVLVGDFRLTD